MDLVVACACGFTVTGTESVVIAGTQEHGRDVHNMDVSRDEVLAMAQPVGA